MSPSSPAEVAVVGSLTMDFTAVATRMPELGETVLGHTFAMVPGGKGNNQAIAAARLGAHVAMVGCVGDDELGPLVRRAVTDEQMTDALVTVTGPTGVAHIMVDDHGDNRIIMVPLANAQLDAAKVHDAFDHLYGSGGPRVVLAQLEVPLDAVRAALTIGRSRGALTVLNPAPAAPLDDALVALCDVLVPNETEAGALTGCDTTTADGCVQAASALGARGARTVVVTRGGAGAVIWRDGEVHEIAPFTVDALDSTAAGDAFCGALCAALADDTAFDEALRRAAGAGALATTVLGASPSLPTLDTLEALCAAQPERGQLQPRPVAK